VRKPVTSLRSTDSGTRGRFRGGGLIARMVPVTVVTSSGLRLRSGVELAAVLVPGREVVERVLHGLQAQVGEKLGPLGPDALEEL
jgi:hypothetical protein